MSRIRTNLITNRMANGAPTVSNGLVISGVTTVTTLDVNGTSDFSGDAVFNSDVDIVDAIVHVGDTDTKIRFPAADTFSVETAGSTRLHIHSDGRFRVGATAQPSATVSGFQLDMGSYPGTLRLMSGAGASGTDTASLAVGGSNHNADITNGNNYGACLLYTSDAADE